MISTTNREWHVQRVIARPSWCMLAIVGLYILGGPSFAWGQERRTELTPVRPTPSLPGVEVCTIDPSHKVTGVEFARLALALPGAVLTDASEKAAMEYCRVLFDNKSTWDDVSKSYLALIAVAYSSQPTDQGKRSAAGGRVRNFVPTPTSAAWEGALLNGLASFLAERAKAETVTWLLDQLRTKLCSDGPNAKDKASRWFPKTCALAEDDAGYGASPPGRIFVAAIREDLEGLPARVVQFAVAKAEEQSLPALGDTLQFLYDAGVAIRSKRDIGGIMQALDAVISAEPYKTSCRAWQQELANKAPVETTTLPAEAPTERQKPASTSTAKVGLNARCVLTTATALLVALHGKVAEHGGVPSPDPSPEEIVGFLQALATNADLKARLTELYGGQLPPDVAIWFDEAKLTAVRDKVKTLITKISALKAALTTFEPTLPETAGETVHRVEALIPPLLDVTDAAMAFFSPEHVPYPAEVFAVLRATERLADTLDALLAAGRAIRQGKRPLEVIAGLSRDRRLRQQCPNAKNWIPVGCAVATAALFLEQAGDIALKTDGSLSDPVVELLYKATLQRGALESALLKLYGVDTTSKLPPFLGKVIDQSKPLTTEVIQPLHHFFEAIRTLEATLSALATDDPKAALEQAPTVLREALDVVDAGTVLVGERAVPYREEILVTGNAMALIVAGDYAGGLRKTIDLFALLAKNPDLTLPEGLRRYLPLAIDLAAAHTPADVQTALESVAAPVGGWRRKHYQRTASLTGFVGLTGGYETPRNDASHSAAPSGWAAGAFASVGLDISFPVGRTLAMGFFVSALDLGQLTSSRLTSTVKGAGTDEVRADIAPEINVTQVFSPGLYGHISLGDSPFTLGVGASFAPALRKYFFTDPAGTTTQALSTWRIGAFLAVDVTILPF